MANGSSAFVLAVLCVMSTVLLAPRLHLPSLASTQVQILASAERDLEMWKGYRVQTSPFRAFPNLCHNYTAYLKTVTSDLSRPFLMDVNPVFKENRLYVYATVSSMHLGFIREECHSDFFLQFGGASYPNTFNKGSPLAGCNQLLFVIPVNSTFNEGDVIDVTLLNVRHKRAYVNVQSCVSVPAVSPLPLAVCSYLCDYNTIPELRSWIAFQRLMNVSKIVFYSATPVPGFNEAFGALIRKGFVEVVDFTWPRLDIGKPIIYNNQHSQINSCFYRLKFKAEAVIMCDVDEYIASEMYPDNLQEVVHFTRNTYPQFDMIVMSSNRYTNEVNDLREREQRLENGTLFDAYQYALSTYSSGAYKMIVFNNFNGMLGVHVCYFCTPWDPVPPNFARVGHFRVQVKDGVFHQNAFFTRYSARLRQGIVALKEESLGAVMR